MRISDWSSDVCSSDLSRRMAKKPLIGSLNRAFITSPDAQVARRLIFSREASQSPVEPPSLYRVPTARSFPSCATALNRRGRTLASCWRRSEEHTSELQSLMRISYAVFCLKKKNKHNKEDQSY